LTAEPTVAKLFINAALANNLEVLNFFLSQKVDPNISDEYGNTALHYVASKGKKETAVFLVEHGADIMKPNKIGATPFSFAENNLSVHYYFREVRADQLAKQELLKNSLPPEQSRKTGPVAQRTRIA